MQKHLHKVVYMSLEKHAGLFNPFLLGLQSKGEKQTPIQAGTGSAVSSLLPSKDRQVLHFLVSV